MAIEGFPGGLPCYLNLTTDSGIVVIRQPDLSLGRRLAALGPSQVSWYTDVTNTQQNYSSSKYKDICGKY